MAESTPKRFLMKGRKMSKIKRYAIDLMGEDGFAEYLNENMEGVKNGKYHQKDNKRV